MALTEYAVALCGFSKQSRLLDVACGDGSTVAYLRQTLGCAIHGLDTRPDAEIQGRAEALPFPDGCFDGVIMECALSQIADRNAALSACARVLRVGGKFLLTDLYARTGGGNGPLGWMVSRETLEAELSAHGLLPIHFADRTEDLITLWAGSLMAGTGGGLSGALHELRKTGVRPGYCLSISQKREGIFCGQST